jgi:hypothetical protein
MPSIHTRAQLLTTICRHHLQAMVDKARDDDCAGVRIDYDVTLIRRVESTDRMARANSPSGAHWSAEGTSVVFRVDVDLSALVADLRHTAKHNLAAQKENNRFWAVQQAYERAGR